MAAFDERIKNFERTRGYIREFLIYGFKNRNEVGKKSPRTYDNERRRIESVFSQHIKQYHGENGKQVYLSIDPEGIKSNPIYEAFALKSFTKNDILLYFSILDILQPQVECSLAEMITCLEARVFSKMEMGLMPDAMTVRNKMNQMVKAGLLTIIKSGKTFTYKRSINILDALSISETHQLKRALAFLSQTEPLGGFGVDILKSQWLYDLEASPFSYKHLFLYQSLDDLILKDVLKALNEQTCLEITLESSKNSKIRVVYGVPVRVSTNYWHGRRYVHLYDSRRNLYYTCRLDLIQKVALTKQKHVAIPENNAYENAYKYSWALSPLSKEGLYTLQMVVAISDESKQFIVDRLVKEGRHGVVTDLGDFRFQYDVEVTDLHEMTPWLRTFIGYIESLTTSSDTYTKRFWADIEAMKALYLDGGCDV